MTEKLSAKVPDTQEGTAASLKDLKRREKSERHVPAAHLTKNDFFFVWGPVMLIVNLTITGIWWKKNVGLRRI